MGVCGAIERPSRIETSKAATYGIRPRVRLLRSMTHCIIFFSHAFFFGTVTWTKGDHEAVIRRNIETHEISRARDLDGYPRAWLIGRLLDNDSMGKERSSD